MNIKIFKIIFFFSTLVSFLADSSSMEINEEDKSKILNKTSVVSQNNIIESDIPGVIGSMAKIAVGTFCPYGSEITKITGAFGKTMFGTPTLMEGLLTTGIKYFSETSELKSGEDGENISEKLSTIENSQFIISEEQNINPLLPAQIASHRDYQSPDFSDKYSSYSAERGNYSMENPEAKQEQNSEMIDEGLYTIKNSQLSFSKDQNNGMLSCSQATSLSGYYTQILSNKCNSYLDERDSYLPDGKYRNNALWQISKAENGMYTIKSHSHEGGLLTWEGVKTYSGYYAQVLADNKRCFSNYYPTDKHKYFPNEEYRKDVLWKISKAEDGKYIIKNIGAEFNSPDFGLLCYTDEASNSGHYTQILHSFEGSHYDKYKDKYSVGGEYRLSMLWEFSRTMH